jgi:hypothetical protein
MTNVVSIIQRVRNMSYLLNIIKIKRIINITISQLIFFKIMKYPEFSENENSGFSFNQTYCEKNNLSSYSKIR